MKKAAAIVACIAGTFFVDATPVAGADPPTSRFGATPGEPQQRAWFDEVKDPLPWLNWGADERIRHEYIPNLYLIDADPPGHDWNVTRLRTRLWGSVSPVKPLTLKARLAYEPRYYFDPPSRETWNAGEALFDNLSATLTLKDLNTTITAGRQDMIFGNGWLVLEGTPLDGSRTIYFDAIRATMLMKPINTTFDGVFIYQSANNDAWLPPIDADERKAQIEQDETGVILYATNKSIEGTQFDGYFLYKHGNAILANGDDADVYAPGLRVVDEFSPHWLARAEAVYEFGDKNGQSLNAWGLNSRLTYRLNDDAKHQFWIGQEVLSGDDPGSDTNEQFDPMWGRWPQWSELYIYTYAVETRIAEITNLYRLNVGWQCNPTKKLELTAGYHALFAMQNTREGSPGFSDDGSFRGHLFTGVASYRFNRFLSGNVVGELLLPGDYYDDPRGTSFDVRDEPAAYVRFEAVITF